MSKLQFAGPYNEEMGYVEPVFGNFSNVLTDEMRKRLEDDFSRFVTEYGLQSLQMRIIRQDIHGCDEGVFPEAYIWFAEMDR